MNKTKISLPVILAFIGALLVIAFLSWAFLQHGTVGLYRVNGFFRWVFIIFGLLGLVLLLLAVLFHWSKIKRTRWLSVISVILSVFAIFIPSVAFYFTSGYFSQAIGDTPPQVLMADGTGAYGVPDMAVVFNSESVTTNTLTWGRESTTATLQENVPSKQHVFMLRDLQPGSTYNYQVNKSSVISFKTPALDGALHFAVASDSHFGVSTARNDLTAEMLGEIARPANGFDSFFFLGDLVEYGFQRSQWRQAFNAFSRTTSVIPTRFTVGNHDTLFSGLNNYNNYCYTQGMAVQTGSRLWYRIDIGKVHFLVLDLEWSAESFTPAQASWLEAQLKTIPAADWKIVLSHGFFYASGLEMNAWKWYDNPETISRLTPLFNKYKVDVVFSGHKHSLELLQNSGVVYVVCGAFGGLPDPASTYISPSSIWEKTGDYGFIDVTLNGNQCTLVFRDYHFEVLKSYTFNKN
jgi:acid phosphatase type 7